MKKADFKQYILHFKRPGGTSRGVLHSKETYILEIEENGKKGIGECGIFRGLSFDDVPGYEEKLKWLCAHINDDEVDIKTALQDYPSIWFGYEQASENLKFGSDIYFENDFTSGNDSIKINGLIWMGNTAFMEEQIHEKLEQKFNCIKLKIGVDWDSEKEVIRHLRSHFPKEQLELRVDANGAFSAEKAETVLQELAELKIHSIEQPIKAGQPEKMALLCRNTPTPIALDEELIGIRTSEEKQKLLEQIRPQYIILKPSLCGGFSGSDEWIDLAEHNGSGWWITSALESNIGLNAIAQYTYSKKPKIPQGLGTGALFQNNFPTRLELRNDRLWHTKK